MQPPLTKNEQFASQDVLEQTGYANPAYECRPDAVCVIWARLHRVFGHMADFDRVRFRQARKSLIKGIGQAILAIFAA